MKHTDPNNKPTAEPPQWHRIPAQLREMNHWVFWRYHWKPEMSDSGKGSWTKIPVCPDGSMAKTTDPLTWSPFKYVRDCWTHWAMNGKPMPDGVGFVFKKGARIVGIDIDNCLRWPDPEGSPVFNEVATEVYETLTKNNPGVELYTEYSPSRTGLHIYAIGDIPHATKDSARGLEIYTDARYFTVTGDALFPEAMILDRTEEILEIQNAILSRRNGQGSILPPQSHDATSSPQNGQPAPESAQAHSPQIGFHTMPTGIWTPIDQRLQIAFKAENGEHIRRLFEGDITGHPSNSEADLALAGLLKFYSDGHPLILEAMMRRSKLTRDKWDKPMRTGGQTHLHHVIDMTLKGENQFWVVPAASPIAEVVAQAKRESSRHTFAELGPRANEFRKSTEISGIRLRWDNVADIFRPFKGAFQITLADSNKGKSTFAHDMTHDLAMGAAKWRTAIVSFEARPVERLINQFAQIHLRKPTLAVEGGEVSDEEFLQACADLGKQLVFFDLISADANAGGIARLCEMEFNERGLDQLVIDPFSNMRQAAGGRQPNLEFINSQIYDLIEYGIARKLFTHVLVHPTKSADRNRGLTLNNANGSYAFWGSCDFGIVIDRIGEALVLEAQKVRFAPLTGRIGGKAALLYNQHTNSFDSTVMPISTKASWPRGGRRGRKAPPSDIPF